MVDIIFELECKGCLLSFISENDTDLCSNCSIENLPRVKDRVIGQKYRKGNDILIWSGSILKCKHNRKKSRCRECKGVGICEHDKRRHNCGECGGISVCKHGREKRKCKECGGKDFCKHNKYKTRCKECGGGSLCKHDKRRSLCKECGGGELCSHEKERRNCRECGDGSAFCKHDKRKSLCKECGGSSICEHDKQRNYCKECKGTSVCIHDKFKRQCLDCFICPENFCTLCKSSSVRKGHAYYPLCFRCYCYSNPSENITRRFKMKENYIDEYLKDNLSDEYTLVHDKIIAGGCSNKRPDWLIDILTHTVIIENDEEQHKNYECENKRMMQLFEDLGYRPLVMIRFNCDKYSGNKNLCFKFSDKNILYPTPEWDKRKETLLDRIKYHCENIPEKEVYLEYLYYDN